MKPSIKKCRGPAEGCHGLHSGPWMLSNPDRSYASFKGYRTWREAIDALADWYAARAT